MEKHFIALTNAFGKFVDASKILQEEILISSKDPELPIKTLYAAVEKFQHHDLIIFSRVMKLVQEFKLSSRKATRLSMNLNNRMYDASHSCKEQHNTDALPVQQLEKRNDVPRGSHRRKGVPQRAPVEHITAASQVSSSWYRVLDINAVLPSAVDAQSNGTPKKHKEASRGGAMEHITAASQAGSSRHRELQINAKDPSAVDAQSHGTPKVASRGGAVEHTTVASQAGSSSYRALQINAVDPSAVDAQSHGTPKKHKVASRGGAVKHTTAASEASSSRHRALVINAINGNAADAQDSGTAHATGVRDIAASPDLARRGRGRRGCRRGRRGRRGNT
jgi:hypothetical protein